MSTFPSVIAILAILVLCSSLFRVFLCPYSPRLVLKYFLFVLVLFCLSVEHLL